MSNEHADRIRNVAFTPVKLGDAYDMDQVDYLLDLLQAAAELGEPLGPVLEGVELNQVRLREGYSIDEVDAFFAEVSRPSVTVDGQTAGPGPGPADAPTPASGSAIEPAEPERATLAAPQSAEAGAAVDTRDVVEVRPGLFARFFRRR